MQDLLVDPVHERLEHLEGLLLVLDERVALAVAAQADPLLEVIERVEVVLPLRVHDLQHDHALVEQHQLDADAALPLLVAGARAPGRARRTISSRPSVRSSDAAVPTPKVSLRAPRRPS